MDPGEAIGRVARAAVSTLQASNIPTQSTTVGIEPGYQRSMADPVGTDREERVDERKKRRIVEGEKLLGGIPRP